MTKWEVLVPVGAGMVFFSIFDEAKIDTCGSTCLAKNDTRFNPANNSLSLENCLVKFTHFGVVS